MKRYQVTFYREIVNSFGRVYRSPLHTIVIDNARSQKRAEQAAKWRCARSRQARRWPYLSTGVDVQVLEDASARRDKGHDDCTGTSG